MDRVDWKLRVPYETLTRLV